jgi:hypothetical protein
VYPLSGMSYSVLLIPALLTAWRYRDAMPGGATTTAVGIALAFALMELREGTATVHAYAFTWMATVIVAWRTGREGAQV